MKSISYTSTPSLNAFLANLGNSFLFNEAIQYNFVFSLVERSTFSKTSSYPTQTLIDSLIII